MAPSAGQARRHPEIGAVHALVLRIALDSAIFPLVLLELDQVQKSSEFRAWW